MAPSSSLLTWCADSLHEVVGFSDAALAEYLVSEARRGGAAAVEQVLQDAGASQPTGAAWAQQLVQRAARSKGRRQQQQEQPRRKTNADWIRDTKQYKLLDLEEDDDDQKKHTADAPPTSKRRDKSKQKKSKKEKKDRNYRSTKEVDDRSRDSEEEGEESALDKLHAEDDKRHGKRRRRSSNGDSNEEKEDGDIRPKETDRERDIRERDELVERMMNRDSKKTKTVDAAESEAALQQRLDTEQKLLRGETVMDEATGTALSLEKLREQSRRVYLKQREERELALLQTSLKDEQELFGNTKLSKAEQKRIALSKQILETAKQSKVSSQDDGFYRLPDDVDTTLTKAAQDQSLLSTRYQESIEEKPEGVLWEEAQMQKAMASSKRNKDTNQYKLLLDDEEEIEFVMQSTSKGYDNREKAKDKNKSDSVGHEDADLAVSEHQKILAGRKKLPVYAYREDFLAAVKDHQVLILVGETGSGKTTQIPQFLHEVGYSDVGKIGCTQPRRIAAMSVASRVAKEMNSRVGTTVGYSIRFENCTSRSTVIQYMTDGMLLREILTEPDLASYSCMVIDEAHERTLHTDILFGLVKDIVRFRPDLKLIISSATLDAEKFSQYFDDASIFMIPGRMFPVDIYYTKAPEADYVDASVVTVLQIHVSQPLDGDILVFLTGQEEIETASEILTERAKQLGSRIPELMVCPVYANLPADQQARIFLKTPKGARKVVLATNIAETSLTIDGICYVIDTGFNKQKEFNARSGMESLVVTPVSQAAANQRAGRAGRTQPGKCFRLFTAWSFQNELEANTVPEILRTNMANVVLMLKSLGINDLIHFDFMDRPPADALIRALEQLYALGALNDRGELTKLGRRMAEFPLEPMLSKAVIVSEKYKCTSEVLSTVAMLSLGASIFYRPKEKAVHADTARQNFARGGGGDHIALLRCYTEWASTDYNQNWCFENFIQVKSMKKARDIREQLEALCERVEVDASISTPPDQDMDCILKAITAGFFYNVAKLGRTGDYQTIKQQKTVYIHPSSVLSKEDEPPAWLVYFELAFTTKEFMRQVAPIKSEWLNEIAPHYYKESDVEDVKRKKVPKQARTKS